MNTENPQGLPIAAANQAVPSTDFITQSVPDLQELFSRDPEQLSDSDISHIVQELRLQRHRFELDESAKALKPKREKKSAGSADAALDQLDLEDLLKGSL